MIVEIIYIIEKLSSNLINLRFIMPAFSFDDTPVYKSRKILFKLIQTHHAERRKNRKKAKKS